MKKVFFGLLILFFLIATFGRDALAGDPCIHIVKEVSVDGGLTWHDANTPGDAPGTAVGQGAKYRLTVTNCGERDLTNVTINDSTLGIIDYAVGDLAAGASIELDEVDIPQLNQPKRCYEIGEKENIAFVAGTWGDATVTTDSDNAWVKCIAPPQPCVDIEKLVSIDGGSTWYDADIEAEAVETEVGQGVHYKLVVYNCGSVALENVTINDSILGIIGYVVGDLAAGVSIELDEGLISKLNQPDRCSEAGKFQNVASVIGNTVTGTEVTDSDPAWVSCVRRGNEGCTPGFWKQEQHFEYWTEYLTSDSFSSVFGRTITIKWSETGKPQPVTDPTLLQALGANGGGINALARHVVAALLNAANPEIEYFYSIPEIIEMFQDALGSGNYEYTKDILKDENESGCPLKNEKNDGHPET
jgi:hypothetical protein